MPNLITLDYFNTGSRRYHIYRIKSSAVAEQPHYHDYYQICFVISGEVEHRQENRTVQLYPGDAFLIPPYFSHSVCFAAPESEIYSLSFSDSAFHSGFSKSRIYRFLTALNEAASGCDRSFIRLKVTPEKEERESLQVLLDCLIREQENSAPVEFSAAPSMITAALYLLARGYYCHPDSAGQRKRFSDYGNSLARCTEFLDSHYAESITLAGLCKRFAMSRSQFCATFPQYTGMTLKQYIRRKRILEAEELLRCRPEMTVGDIARHVGYEDESTFYRNFIKVTGAPPSLYRREITGDSLT